MINKEEYEKGLRCKGICFKCKDNSTCYQGIQFNKARESSTIEELKEELKSKDIKIQWLEKMVNYYIQFKPDDSESFKMEYDCKWISEPKNKYKEQLKSMSKEDLLKTEKLLED